MTKQTVQTTAPRTVVQPTWSAVAALLGFSAVALGAMAAHAVADPNAAQALERAAIYQLIHACVLLYATGLSGTTALLARSLLLSGIVLFCGSIELKYLFSVAGATTVAPTGGIALILGWLLLGISAARRSGAKS